MLFLLKRSRRGSPACRSVAGCQDLSLGFRYEEAGASSGFHTRWFRTATFPQVQVLFHQKDVLYREPGLIEKANFFWQGRNVQGRVKGRLSVRQLSRSGRGRSISPGLMKVPVTAASQRGLLCSVFSRLLRFDPA